MKHPQRLPAGFTDEFINGKWCVMCDLNHGIIRPQQSKGSPAIQYSQDRRKERKDQEAFVIACVLFYVLGWPIGDNHETNT